MHRKPPVKFQVFQAHFKLLGSLPIVLVAEGRLLVINVENPVVGDGDFVGVAPQVFEQGLGVSKRSFGIHHPVFSEERVNQFFKRNK